MVYLRVPTVVFYIIQASARFGLPARISASQQGWMSDLDGFGESCEREAEFVDEVPDGPQSCSYVDLEACYLIPVVSGGWDSGVG
jgi:hypothetical protein